MRRWVLGLAIAIGLAGCGDDGGGELAHGSGGAGGRGGAPGGVGMTAAVGGLGGAGGSGAGGTPAGDAAVVESDASHGGQDAGDAAADAGPIRRGLFDVPALPFPLEPGERIEAPELRWSFVGFPDSRCANGTSTGIAINPIEDPQGLLIFMQGGGACWDSNTCLVANTSVHLDDTVDGPVV